MSDDRARLEASFAGVQAAARRKEHNRRKRTDGVVVGRENRYGGHSKEVIAQAQTRARTIAPDAPFLDEDPATQLTAAPGPTVRYVSPDDARYDRLARFAAEHPEPTEGVQQDLFPMLEAAE